jgi:hypothetical protein
MQDIDGRLYSRIPMNFVKNVIAIKKLGRFKTKSMAKLVTTLLKELFMKWGLYFIGPIKLA